jgi:2-polyprenyl-3-methyl-5-hydroxy-6-metoxy-1,4-benzoquinol methylase
MGASEVDRLEELKSFYEKGDYMDYLLMDRCNELILKTARTRTNALEIGCGEGYSTKYLSDHFADLEVLDASAGNLDLMRARIAKDIICHNVLIEDFTPSRKYENVFVTHVLEHVEDPIDCLRRLEALLGDEGQLYIAVPNCMALNRRAGHLMGLLESYDTLAPKDHLVGHRRLYTVDMLREHCAIAGLKVIEMKGIYLKPLSEAQMYSLGDSAVKAFYRLGEDVPQYCADLFAVATKKYY